MQKKSIGIVFGGNSAESQVSVITALMIEKNIRGMAEYDFVFLYLSRDNKFYLIPQNKMNVQTFKSGECESQKYQVVLGYNGSVFKSKSLLKKKCLDLYAVINCCHGGAGENGVLSGFMKMLNIPFSTSSCMGMGISMDKNLFKHILRSNSVLVPDWVFVSKKDWKYSKTEVFSKVKTLKFPVIVKPNSSGSSLGVSVVKNEEEFEQKVDIAFEFDSNVIIEKLIENKVEFNCAVLGDTCEIIVSDVDQVQGIEELFSFEDKYIGKPSEKAEQKNKEITQKSNKKGMEQVSRLLPAPIGDKLKNKLQETSAIVFNLIGLSGISRVDYLYDEKKKKLYVGEINSVPGSLALYFFKNTKMGVRGVIEKLINIAINSSASFVKINEKFIPKIY